MKKFLMILILILLFILGLGWYLNPIKHFDATRIPVLVKPIETDKNEQTFIEYKKVAAKENKSFNVLILGIDARGKEESRADVIMLANINPRNKEINIISIPRDTRVFVEGIGYTKINHSHLLGEIKGGNHLGTQSSLQTVSNFLQAPIHYYIKTNFEGFINFIDTIGGIDIELNESVAFTYDDIILNAGDHHLDGRLALILVRERRSLPDGDFGRQKHQLLVLKGIAKKLLDVRNIEKTPTFLKQAKYDILDTNFTDSDLISLFWLLRDLSSENIRNIQIPGHEDFYFDPLIKKNLYYWVPDLEKIKEITEEYLQS